ncbi:hypothetical protein X777_12847 [Ooceraea biroi]|uniref:Uncharacterized protein n=1 Tax=Ooceraea biroi TaxID=2015173 RepID=A0A026VZW3_OOCBI|nr:hypothetical protein X777_12847 [Ooceraea biroi]
MSLLAQLVENNRKLLGGPEIIVEVDEAKSGRRKYNRGRVIRGQWIFEMIATTIEKMIKTLITTMIWMRNHTLGRKNKRNKKINRKIITNARKGNRYQTQPETASAVVMKYLLDKKTAGAQIIPPTQQPNAIDTFFSSIASTNINILHKCNHIILDRIMQCSELVAHFGPISEATPTILSCPLGAERLGCRGEPAACLTLFLRSVSI